jgi:hypothetical protein
MLALVAAHRTPMRMLRSVKVLCMPLEFEMPLLKSSLFVLAAATVLFVSGNDAQAQNRNTTNRRTTQGMNSGGMGTSPTQGAIQSAQNQARSIAARQHQIWLAHRLKKNAEEKAAQAKAAEAKAAAKAAATETSKTSTPASTSTKTTK